MNDLVDHESAESGSAEGRCPARRFPLRTPESHKPPIERFSADLPQTTKVAVLFLGLQSKDENLLRDALAGFLACETSERNAPVYTDHAAYTDPQGYRNLIAALYWLDAPAYRVWLEQAAVIAWRGQVGSMPSVGVWWEPIVVDAGRMETITFKEFRRGFSGCPVTSLQNTERSGYWGAARDRIPLAAEDQFESTISGMSDKPEMSTQTYRKLQPPKNMAVIRSGVSWEKCEGEQLEDYQQRIKPKLDAGMDYLRNNPVEAGCFSLRQVSCIGGVGEPLAEGYSLGLFVSMGHLEAWAENHPSHLAIYTRAMAARRKYQDALQLRTYNEIFIIDEHNPAFEYFNCHPHTGLLPYARMLGSAG